METFIRKPKVFLSHSKQNTSFINQVTEDLRQCQIEPWLDTIEIRAGKPWLDVIFSHGIPSCDAVLVYLTQESIQSKMVQKEIDASLIQQLSENSIAFLPYISTSELRGKLRPDLRALQVPEWHLNNYDRMIPRVIAEIWRSYSERAIESAIQSEKVKKLEAQLALEKIRQTKDEGIFSKSEHEDFSFIWKALNKEVVVILESRVANPIRQLIGRNIKGPAMVSLEATMNYTLNIGGLVDLILDRGINSYSDRNFSKSLLNQCAKEFERYLPELENKQRNFKWKSFPYFEKELLMYGLLQTVVFSDDSYGHIRTVTKSVVNDKMYRLKYWMEVQDIYDEKPLIIPQKESLKIIDDKKDIAK